MPPAETFDFKRKFIERAQVLSGRKYAKAHLILLITKENHDNQEERSSMLRKLDHNNMGKSNLGWLQSTFHFSFADYYNPANINFGTLRVINDDLIAPKTGFDTHPHRDMEIISY